VRSDERPAGPGPTLTPILERIAAGTINVLIRGETGVGKEVMARMLHERSPRAKAPLVCLNCAAFSESLLEGELFGYEKGAFTGAMNAKAGLLELAQGGTLFLDEVGEMPLTLQAKLLRVFEQREVWRLGALKPRPIDARFLSATNRDLEKEIAAGRFREDLYFRLNGITLQVPPLRDRPDEIEALALQFLAQASSLAKQPVPPALTPQAVVALRAHSWPGNVRELRNVMERALLLSGGEAIRPDHLQADRGPLAFAPRPATDDRADYDRQRIVSALEKCGGNQTHAAKLLGVSRRTLITWMEQHDLPRPRKRSD
jgi:transcriptional regulator with PAS, ATPase and Fis domain